MSYILDALKRSEQERRDAEAPAPVAAAPAAAPARRSWLMPVIALGLLGNAAVLAWALWPQAEPTTITAAEPSLAAAAGAGAPSRPAAPLAAVAAVRVEVPPAAGSAEVRRAAPAANTAPSVAQRAPQPATPVATAAPRPSEPVRENAPIAAAPAPADTDERVPQLFELPVAVRSRIPPVNVNVHVYAEQPSARWALIDLKRVQEGGELPNGMRLEKITPDGLQLNFQGQRFLLNVRQ